MKARMLLSTAAIALLTVGSAIAQGENRKPDDPSRPQAQTPSMDRQRGERPSQPQAKPQSHQQGRQGAQGSQPPSTTGQAPQQPQNGQAQKGSQRDDATSSEQQRKRQTPQRTEGKQERPSPRGAQTRQQSDDDQKRSGQAQQDTQSPRESTTRSRDGQGSGQSGTASSPQGAQSGQQQDAQQRGSAGGQGASVQLNEQQRTRISATISEQKVRPLSNVNFSVSIGTAVPRSVRLQTLPSTIVSIVPQYRGYSYVVVEDRIVIIEPKTRKIVTTIEYSGGSKARAASRKKLELTTEQRAAIRKHATSERRATTGSRASTRITVGERVPESIELHSFPSTVYEEVPVVREYRYFVRDRDVVVVDPGEQRIIEIIR